MTETEKTESTEKERRMPFIEHLEELRWRLFKIIGSVVVLAVVSYVFSQHILDAITRMIPADTALVTLKPTQMFIVRIKLSFYMGIIASIPVIVYQFWQFVAPGLFPKERRVLFPVIFFTLFCFLLGGAFAYLLIIPRGLAFLAAFQTPDIQATWSIDSYISFVTMLVIVFGIVFEIPLLATFLAKLGLINYKMMGKIRRPAILSAFILGAALTPPDGFTQVALAIPLWILYEISIILVRIFGPKPDEDDEN